MPIIPEIAVGLFIQPVLIKPLAPKLMQIVPAALGAVTSQPTSPLRDSVLSLARPPDLLRSCGNPDAKAAPSAH